MSQVRSEIEPRDVSNAPRIRNRFIPVSLNRQTMEGCEKRAQGEPYPAHHHQDDNGDAYRRELKEAPVEGENCEFREGY